MDDPIYSTNQDSCDHNTYRDTLTQMDHAILELEERLHTLRVTRNTFLPVGRLPPELLLKVFEFAMLSRKGNTKMHRLLKFTWVSHRWRNTALDWPTLWSTINKTTRGWELQCVARSKGATLSVDLSDGAMELSPFVPEPHRIRQLQVVTPWNSPYQWHRPAPALEFFSAQSMKIQDNMFSGICPLLKELELRYCEFTWTPLLFSRLTRLCLVHPQPAIPLNSLLPQLNRMPTLISLILRSAVSSDISGDLPSVILPNLSNLELVGAPADASVALIEEITITEDVSLVVECFPPIWADQVRVLGALERMYSPPRIIDTLQTSTLRPGYMTFKYRSPNNRNTSEGLVSFHLPDGLKSFFSSFGYRRLSQVQSLTLGLGEYVSVETWKHSLGSLEHLRDLHLYRSAALSFIHFLSAEYRRIASPRRGNQIGKIDLWTASLSFPALQTLAFRYITREELLNQHETALALREAFSLRRTCGQGLQKFILPIGAFRQVYVDIFDEVVDEVVEEPDPIEVFAEGDILNVDDTSEEESDAEGD
ncbi:hypothetical protein BDN72DRAFT_837553 [Pluteus cervinus]|uniref:Uncharacterized protein n=1 Tax=Pluteus cervinus TaxID=181527 RepID=A0ACD3B1K7_9AGAR|nr:hypothetical protein BDN72DRAFT_837553 [Pluteus cervinus]